MAIQYIPNATYDMWLNALSWEFYLLKYLPKDMFTLEICTTAINKRPYFIKFVPKEFQTEELCLLAIHNNRTCDKLYIKNMTDTIYLELKKTGTHFEHQTD